MILNNQYVVIAPSSNILSIAIISTFLIGIVSCYIFHPVISAYRHRRPVSSRLALDMPKAQLLDTDTYMSEELLLSPPRSSVSSKEKHLLSLIIPAYNEQERLPKMLHTTMNDLISSREEIMRLCIEAIRSTDQSKINIDLHQCPFEIIVVNDGSKDDTISVVKDLVSKFEFGTSKKYFTIRLLSLSNNSGKGAAVRAGMINSDAELLLMVDADGATEFSFGIKQVLTEIAVLAPTNKGMKVVFGSRAHLQNESTARRSLARTILMHSFHFFVKTFCSNNIRDTQCGFKLFTQPAAYILFINLHLTKWAFDTEIVVLAERLGIPIGEVGVKWDEVGGSKLATNKVSLILSSIGMLRDMICVRICYSFGIWNIIQGQKDTNNNIK